MSHIFCYLMSCIFSKNMIRVCAVRSSPSLVHFSVQYEHLLGLCLELFLNLLFPSALNLLSMWSIYMIWYQYLSHNTHTTLYSAVALDCILVFFVLTICLKKEKICIFRLFSDIYNVAKTPVWTFILVNEWMINCIFIGKDLLIS